MVRNYFLSCKQNCSSHAFYHGLTLVRLCSTPEHCQNSWILPEELIISSQPSNFMLDMEEKITNTVTEKVTETVKDLLTQFLQQQQPKQEQLQKHLP